jgi:hypothetical protein
MIALGTGNQEAPAWGDRGLTDRRRGYRGVRGMPSVRTQVDGGFAAGASSFKERAHGDRRFPQRSNVLRYWRTRATTRIDENNGPIDHDAPSQRPLCLVGSTRDSVGWFRSATRSAAAKWTLRTKGLCLLLSSEIQLQNSLRRTVPHIISDRMTRLPHRGDQHAV